MEWLRGESELTFELEGEDPRKEAERAAQLMVVHARPVTPRLSGSVWIAAPLFLVGSCLTGVHHHSNVNLAGVILIVAALVVGMRALPIAPNSYRAPAPMKLTSVFVLRITPQALTLTADGRIARQVPLAAIADVVVGTLIEIVHQDGSRTDLVTPEPSFVNEETAAAIRTGVREMRAQTSDYRGRS